MGARPNRRQLITYDTEVKGFGVRVTNSGVKSFILNYRINGIERRITIGRYPDWTVAAARERAKYLKREVDSGNDPLAERQELRALPTVADLASQYISEYLPRKRPGSRRDDTSMIEQDILPSLGAKRVRDVTTLEIERLHRRISARAPIRANRVIALLSKMFSLATRWGLCDDNPTKGIERNPEQSRERYLSENELGGLWAALEARSSHPASNVVKLLLLTGARVGEILNATWDQFDLKTGVWTKPSSHTKQKREHRVPLSQMARDILVTMEAETTSPFLFPGTRNDRPLAGIRKFWHAVCEVADITDVRVHDLRHTYASILASDGQSLPVIGALLGHSQPTTTARYAHLFHDPLLEATDQVSRAVLRAGGTNNESNEDLEVSGNG